MLDATGLRAQRLLQADLISGALELAALVEHGIPSGRIENFQEQPRVILERLFQTVEPSDLAPPAASLWARARRFWREHERLSWAFLEAGGSESARSEAAWIREHGMGIGLIAPRAARQLLALSCAKDALRAAEASATSAVESMREAVRGVF